MTPTPAPGGPPPPELTWYTGPDVPEFAFPAWRRSVALGADGTVYAPAVVAGPEDEVLARATRDGVPSVQGMGHVYFPTGWLAGLGPDAAETCQYIEDWLSTVD